MAGRLVGLFAAGRSGALRTLIDTAIEQPTDADQLGCASGLRIIGNAETTVRISGRDLAAAGPMPKT